MLKKIFAYLCVGFICTCEVLAAGMCRELKITSSNIDKFYDLTSSEARKYSSVSFDGIEISEAFVKKFEDDLKNSTELTKRSYKKIKPKNPFKIAFYKIVSKLL